MDWVRSLRNTMNRKWADMLEDFIHQKVTTIHK